MNFTGFNYFLLNNMITKIDARKIDHKSNIGTIVLDNDNLIDNKSKQNYEDQFKINQM
jgi:hypothetical protein